MSGPRFQFRLITLFWITLVVASFFGGMRVERWRVDREELAKPEWPAKSGIYHGGPVGDEAAQ